MDLEARLDCDVSSEEVVCSREDEHHFVNPQEASADLSDPRTSRTLHSTQKITADYNHRIKTKIEALNTLRENSTSREKQ